MEMSKVKQCEITECAYNMDNCCHAMAITIGNSGTPKCDTFCQSTIQGGEASCCAGVGACKTSACTFNSHLECSSPDVMVGYNGQEADCLTFRPK